MKKLVLIAMAVMLSVGTTYAAGGKNRGDVGKGKVITGSQAKGQTTLPRTGR